MNILEKLGIIGVLRDSTTEDTVIMDFSSKEHCDQMLSLYDAAPEMLEALIEDVLLNTQYMSNDDIKLILNTEWALSAPFYKIRRDILIIQKATKKSWEEIKEILNED